jgi:hypothetical protein
MSYKGPKNSPKTAPKRSQKFSKRVPERSQISLIKGLVTVPKQYQNGLIMVPKRFHQRWLNFPEGVDRDNLQGGI